MDTSLTQCLMAQLKIVRDSMEFASDEWLALNGVLANFNAENPKLALDLKKEQPYFWLVGRSIVEKGVHEPYEAIFGDYVQSVVRAEKLEYKNGDYSDLQIIKVSAGTPELMERMLHRLKWLDGKKWHGLI